MASSSAVPLGAVPAIPSLPPVAPIPTAPSFPRRRARPLERPAPALRFPSSPSLYPWLARRFSAGEATLWVGPARPVEGLLELLYAGVIATGGRISLLEGANRFHPYRIAERIRSLNGDASEGLERIRLARAFTAYQMVALVDAWAREVRAQRPSLLVAHEVPTLFFETEFPQEERAPLLRHIATVLQRLARTLRVPMLLTVAGGISAFPGLAEAGPRLFDLVRVRPGPLGLSLEAYQESTRLDLVHRPDGQRGLDEFDPHPAQEVTAWAGPSRRIGRRSRSG